MYPALIELRSVIFNFMKTRREILRHTAQFLYYSAYIGFKPEPSERAHYALYHQVYQWQHAVCRLGMTIRRQVYQPLWMYCYGSLGYIQRMKQGSSIVITDCMYFEVKGMVHWPELSAMEYWLWSVYCARIWWILKIFNIPDFSVVFDA